MTPDFSRGYLRLPLSVWLAVYCRGALTRRQLQLVSVVIRESWGWRAAEGAVHTWTRPLSTRQFAAATGLSIDHLHRDLRQLLDRGVLRGREGRYQFVPDPKRWITPALSAPDLRGLPPEGSDPSDEIAPLTLGSKKGYRKQRNVAEPSETELSPAVENSSSRASFARSRSSGGGAGIGATAARRFADVIAAFVGSLSTREAETLRLWIYEAGVAAVWSALEPSFRLGAAAGRRRLRNLLAAQRKGAP